MANPFKASVREVCAGVGAAAAIIAVMVIGNQLPKPARIIGDVVLVGGLAYAFHKGLLEPRPK